MIRRFTDSLVWECRLDETDRKILDEMQVAFPMERRPWEVLGKRLGMPSGEVLERVRRLKEEGIIRQTSPIFDTRALGYSSGLVAASVPSERIEEIAAVLNEHPGVSHNYERDHRFNLWFTIAVPPGESLEEEVARLTERAGIREYRILPAIRVFKIGVRLKIGDSGRTPETSPRRKSSPPLSERDRKFVRVLQDDLPWMEEPFAPAAERLGATQEEVLAWLDLARENGWMRRFAAVLHHRKAGFTANGMVCWRVPEEHIEEAGRKAAAFPEVSHCYQRPTCPDWPYNLFTMIHGRSKVECEETARCISEAIGVKDYVILYSTREFKKERVKYFVK